MHSALRNLPKEREDARRARVGLPPRMPQDYSDRDLTGELLNAGSLALSPVPFVGDALGLGADYRMYQTKPEERTMGNYAMTLAGLLPFVPSASATKTAVRSAEAIKEGAKRGIDLAEADRMQRAAEQGFDTNNIAYRGLAQEYDPDKSGNYQMFTSSAEDAGGYATANPLGGGANIVPAYIKKGNNLEIDAGGRNFNNISVESLPKSVQLRLHPSIESAARTDDIAYAAKEAGYDSVTINNVYDNITGLIPSARKQPQSDSLSDDRLLQELGIKPENMPPASTRLNSYTADINQKPVTITTVFDPANIRSKFAKFDKSQRLSRNISAGVAGTALGLSALRNISKDNQGAE